MTTYAAQTDRPWTQVANAHTPKTLLFRNAPVETTYRITYRYIPAHGKDMSYVVVDTARGANARFVQKPISVDVVGFLAPESPMLTTMDARQMPSVDFDSPATRIRVRRLRLLAPPRWRSDAVIPYFLDDEEPN